MVRFDQRHGESPLPTQLQPDQITNELAALLWGFLHSLLKQARDLVDYGKSVVNDDWRRLLWQWNVMYEHKPSHQFSNEYDHSVETVRAIVYDRGWATLYTFIEFFVGHERFSFTESAIAEILTKCHAAWRLVDGAVVPISSPEQAEAVVDAFGDIEARGPAGAKAHLANAASAIASKDWAGSVRESIHAVESVARTFDEAKTLGDALKSIQSAGKPIHPALARGMSAWYGYASDEAGIRHALLEEGTAAVDENEAVFMFGACASFCQYLLNVTG